MKFQELLKLVGNEPVFDTTLLLAGDVQRQEIQRQLARWAQKGYVNQVRRGLYSIAPPYRHVTPHPFLVANRMVKASYVSCQSALAWYSLIPEYTPVTISITTQRPDTWKTFLGRFVFRHVKTSLLFGYTIVDVTASQQAFVAYPEKALLDLVHLTPNGDELLFLEGLRLQNLERLDHERMTHFAERTGSAKLQRAACLLQAMAHKQAIEFETL